MNSTSILILPSHCLNSLEPRDKQQKQWHTRAVLALPFECFIVLMHMCVFTLSQKMKQQQKLDISWKWYWFQFYSLMSPLPIISLSCHEMYAFPECWKQTPIHMSLDDTSGTSTYLLWSKSNRFSCRACVEDQDDKYVCYVIQYGFFF